MAASYGRTAYQIISQASAAQADGARGGQWSVPWSDLMLTMFVLFLGLYAYSVGPSPESAKNQPVFDGAGEAEQVEAQERRLVGLYEQMRQRLDPLLGPENVSYLPAEGIRIYLPQRGFFGSLDGALQPAAQPVLREVADLLHMVRSRIVIAGYASETPRGGALGPFELAVLRAARVATFLSSEGGIDPAMLTVQGYGLAYPRVPAVSREAIKRNQRVEIQIAPEGK